MRLTRRTIAIIFLTLYTFLPCFPDSTQGEGAAGSNPYPTLKTEISDFSIDQTGSVIPAQRTQPALSPTAAISPEAMLLLSLSSRDYPVTPGDTYQFTYVTPESAVTAVTVVGSDYTVNLGVLGKVDAYGLSFPELKIEIEQRISGAYPDSSPSVTIVSNGRFRVFVKGEVNSAGCYTAWGLTRLSRVVEPFLTPYSSKRDVLISSPNGQSETFDLFSAIRFGEWDQDPYVRPGDTVIVNKRDRAVRLTGAVKREGIYQLRRGEGLQELIEYYGDGFTELADPSRIRLQRLLTESERIAESSVVDLSRGFRQRVELMNLDSVIVPQKTERLPVVFLEGAVITEDEQESDDSDDENIEKYGKLTIPFAEGETLFTVLKYLADSIDPRSDLANAYLIREQSGGVVPVDLAALLYAYDPQDDISLEPYDRLIIPFTQYSVLVTGGVIDPGRYPYMPNKTYRYYVDLAGGVDPDKGNLRGVRIMDRDNNRISTDLHLDPETRVHVPYSFSYYFLKYFPLAVSTATAVYYTVLVIERL